MNPKAGRSDKQHSATSSFVEFLEFIKEPVQTKTNHKMQLEMRIREFKTLLAKLEALEQDTSLTSISKKSEDESFNKLNKPYKIIEYLKLVFKSGLAILWRSLYLKKKDSH
ncbi:hypothetical protein O181_073448 [Austropuccinia psidii MF-1]|uniref:Uncharacterized protein n=1 Tax=Austropuccinia psidii MF-1 TaxID=1389203 RepID=A0A9Q3F510_9BASI|nr:hypothetical protein [Austropuccinia psidii MF-1]